MPDKSNRLSDQPLVGSASGALLLLGRHPANTGQAPQVGADYDDEAAYSYAREASVADLAQDTYDAYTLSPPGRLPKRPQDLHPRHRHLLAYLHSLIADVRWFSPPGGSGARWPLAAPLVATAIEKSYWLHPGTMPNFVIARRLLDELNPEDISCWIDSSGPNWAAIRETFVAFEPDSLAIPFIDGLEVLAILATFGSGEDRCTDSDRAQSASSTALSVILAALHGDPPSDCRVQSVMFSLHPWLLAILSSVSFEFFVAVAAHLSRRLRALFWHMARCMLPETTNLPSVSAPLEEALLGGEQLPRLWGCLMMTEAAHLTAATYDLLCTERDWVAEQIQQLKRSYSPASGEQICSFNLFWKEFFRFFHIPVLPRSNLDNRLDG
ncbi:hypothetical protein DFJ73DRAFT_873217 [Zopfochytrium polystomum]|nr:hypothetical protein DFJ73DRAFT_873217 [Zopfochytrium polystomum]